MVPDPDSHLPLKQGGKKQQRKKIYIDHML